MSKEEVFLRNVKKTNRGWRIDFKLEFEDQTWIYYLTAGSFAFLIIMNYLLPETYSIQPSYDFKVGLIGLGLTAFGMVFLLCLLCFGSADNLTSILIWFILAAITVALLYFGVPLLFGFSW